MKFTLTLMNEANARVVQTWQYAAPYEIYSYTASAETLAELLERRSPHYAVRDESGELVGFFCYGTSAQVWNNEAPALYSQDGIIDIGLGMRPDLTGKGLGLSFVEAGLAFAREHFAPQVFRLFVLTFNERAARVYERAGFARVRVFVQPNPVHGELEFLEMRYEV